jgi:hypothetical protein
MIALLTRSAISRNILRKDEIRQPSIAPGINRDILPEQVNGLNAATAE